MSKRQPSESPLLTRGDKSDASLTKRPRVAALALGTLIESASDAEFKRRVERVLEIINDSLECSPSEVMLRSIELVQGLKWLYDQDHAPTASAFDELYTPVLDYVGLVFNIVLEEPDSSHEYFASMYKYVVDLIASHAFKSRAQNQRAIHALLAPMVLHPSFCQTCPNIPGARATFSSLVSMAVSAAPRHSPSTLEAWAPVHCAIIECLPLVVPLCGSQYLGWIAAVADAALDAEYSSVSLRLAAWSYLPALCHAFAAIDRDVWADLGNARVLPDDPTELLEAVAYLVGYISCASAGCLVDPYSIPDEEVDTVEDEGPNSLWYSKHEPHLTHTPAPHYSCRVCRQQFKRHAAPSHCGPPGRKQSLRTWLGFWFIVSNQQPPIARIGFVESVARFVNHAPLSDLSLHASPFGTNVISIHTSQFRELRLAVNLVISAYVADTPWDPDAALRVKRENRCDAMRQLTKYAADSASNATAADETLQVAVRVIGTACHSDEAALGEALAFLLERFCGPNIFLKAVAYEQLHALSQSRSEPLPIILCRHSKRLSLTVVKALDRDPHTFSECVELLGMSPRRFFRSHLDHLLPPLVISNQREILIEIAKTVQHPLPMLCINHGHHILSKIFLMDGDNELMQQALQSFLELVTITNKPYSGSQDHSGVTITNIVRSCSVQLVFLLVLELGNADPALRRRAYDALYTVKSILDEDADEASLSNKPRPAVIVLDDSDNPGDLEATGTSMREGPGSATLKRQGAKPMLGDKPLDEFLVRHILSILAYLNEILHAQDRRSRRRSRRLAMPACPAGERVQALRAIKKVILIIGAKATKFLSNLVATLSAPLKGGNLIVCIEAWKALAWAVKDASLSCEALNTLLIPLLERFSTKGPGVPPDSSDCEASDSEYKTMIAEVIETLLLDRETTIKSFWPLLCPIPRSQALGKVREMINRLQGVTLGPEKHIEYLVELLKHTNPVVVWHAASELHHVLDMFKSDVATWKSPANEDGFASDAASSAFPTKRGPQLLAKLLGTLTIACGTIAAEFAPAREACAACIGQIGAVDFTQLFSGSEPNLGSTRYDYRSDGIATSVTLYDLVDPEDRLEFCCELIIDYLAPAFGFARSPNAQANAAYAIQELLKLLEFPQALCVIARGSQRDERLAQTKDSGTATKRGRKHRSQSPWHKHLQERWELLPQNIVTLVTPLLTSKYAIRAQPSRATPQVAEDAPARITQCSTCSEWVATWLLDLVALIEDGQVRALFETCTSVIKGNINGIPQYLLPVVINHLLWADSQGKSDRFARLIRRETMAVLSVDRASFDVGGGVSQHPLPSQRKECIQIVFKLLDHIEGVIHRHKQQRATQSRAARRGNQSVVVPPFDLALSDFLGSIPHLALGDAAFRCDQYTRSLKHYEMHIRQNSPEAALWFFNSKRPTTGPAAASTARAAYGSSSNQKEDGCGSDIESVVARIQRIYAAMDEADGVAGCAARRAESDLELDILWWESQGNWTQAQIGYEALLQSNPESSKARLGWIQCLQRMGQLGAAWTTAKNWRGGRCAKQTPQVAPSRAGSLRPPMASSKSAHTTAQRVDASGLESTMRYLSLDNDIVVADPDSSSSRNRRASQGADAGRGDSDDGGMETLYAAAAWRLGKWDEYCSHDAGGDGGRPGGCDILPWDERQPLSNVRPADYGFDIGIGVLFSSLQQGLISPAGEQSHVRKRFADTISALRAQVARDIASRVAMEVINVGALHSQNIVYTKAIDLVVRMHMLADVEMLGQHIWPAEKCAGTSASQPGGDNSSSSSSKNGSAQASRVRIDDEAKLMPLLLQWLERLNYLPSHYASQEPVLALHQQLYGIIRNYGTNSNNQTAQTELTKHTALVLHRSVELSRASGSYSVALSSLLQAETSNPRLFQLHPALHHERAQVLWELNNKFEATKSLQRAINAMYRAIEAAVKGVIGPPPSVPDPLDLVMPADNVKAAQFKAAYTNAVVDLAEWQGELHEANIMTIVGHYEKVMRVQEDGKVHYALGKFYDNILKAAIEKSQQISDPAKDLTNRQYTGSLRCYVVRHYSRAVQYDIQYLFQALPRLLMVWMDFGQMVLSPPDCEDSRIKERFNNSNRIMSNLARRLPAYNFLMVFSQIVSRICHPNPDVLAIIERIIRSVLLLYPQQGLWQLSAVSRSRYQVRANRCSSIISKVLADPEAEVGLHTPHSLIQHVTKLNQKLLELCNKSVGSRSVTTLSMARDFPSLNRMAPIEVIVPIQSSLIPKFPTYSDNTVTSSYLTSVRLHSSRNGGDLATPEAGTLTQHIRARMFKPFPSTLATISGFRDRVELINSLVRPKRITIVGSDGREYSFLCKPKDDLRKDSRLMEFNSMINQFLKTDLESRKRGLHIRTYSVVPLNEECGLIEWVNYTVGIRRVLVKLYREKGLTVPNSVVKGILELNKPSPEEIFLKKLLPKFPPVLYQWFLNAFPDPASWYLCRTAFARTTAVMSMVGYVLGLGDRHGENILLDELCGGIMHVDFNCLFDKGLQLRIPERVPFRLTHNMVDAMGVTGYEGAFRKSCEVTMRLLRNNKDALMSVLTPFIHDPLCEWSTQPSRSSRSLETGEAENDRAAQSLRVIAGKLQGIHQSNSSLPLSVEGQVDELIREATDPKRLFKMYIGWAAYM